MNKPNYEESTIVNLMSSITKKFGGEHDYNELKALPRKSIEKYESIVLVVIDALGYDYLQNQKESFLYKNLHAKITSIFPTTTSCANIAFFCGYPAQQTGLHNWYVNSIKAEGILSALPFKLKTDKHPNSLEEKGFVIEDFVKAKSLHKEFNANTFIISSPVEATSNITKYLCRDATLIASEGFQKILDDTKKVSQYKGKKFVHAYIGELDKIMHIHGPSSQEVKDLFQQIDEHVEDLAKNLSKNTKLIVVSDHGQIESDINDIVHLQELGLDDCYSTKPVANDRVVDFFIRPHKVEKFEKEIKNKIGDKGTLHKGVELIKKGYFGKGTVNNDLKKRVGDYILIMNKNYVMKDKPFSPEFEDEWLGYHGALTDNEFYVPLITYN